MASERTVGSPEQVRARAIRDMFSAIAGPYDLLNHTLSLGQDIRWRRRAVAMLSARPREYALDACGGTGDFGLEALRQNVAERVVLADFALPMVRRAVDKNQPDEHWMVTVADGLRLPFADQTFDLVLCAFGVRNLVDIEGGLAELHRVLRPGGELLVLEFMGDNRGVLYSLFLLYFRWILPWIGRLVSRHPGAYCYLPRSVARFLSRSQWLQLLERIGFADLNTREFSLGIATATQARRLP